MGGGAGGGGVCSRLRYLYGIVWMCVPNTPLFQRCKVYGKVPFFNKKVYDLPDFTWFLCKCPIFSHPVYAIFSDRDIKRMFLNELSAISV